MNNHNPILYSLCSHCVSIMDGWIPYPSTCIARSTQLDLKTVRKELKRLKKDGLIDSDLYVDTDSELERPILVRGYIVTEKGKQTEEYKHAHELERRICKEIFNFDIGEVGHLDTLLENNVEVHLNDL